ncbi:MAG: adenylate/guanylate cyclase domain-containing protein [Pseudomonadota bacterium]
MSIAIHDRIAAESATRLIRAEQSGLRIALACRTAITGIALAWYVLGVVALPQMDARLGTIAVLLLFTAMGLAHLAVIGTRFDRAWIKYVVYAADVLAICAVFALVPISETGEIPQIIAFRAYGIYYLFPLVALSALSLSWRLVIWTGAVACAGWWGGFAYVTQGMDRVLSWADMPGDATRADYETIFLSIDFIGRGNRIEETGLLMFASLALAVAVYRARAVFFAQVASDVGYEEEREARARISDLFGQYVPEQIAQTLIKSGGAPVPERSEGTALVLDIESFTRFSASRPPEEVISALDAFLSDAAEAVGTEGGVVISYLGDGFLVTFNAPLRQEQPAAAALRAAVALPVLAQRHGFAVRIGLASGPLVTGTIGSARRKSFTVYGDAVNRAARLEALCKSLGERILIDAATHAALIGTSLRPLGTHALPGLPAAIEVFAPAQQPLPAAGQPHNQGP